MSAAKIPYGPGHGWVFLPACAAWAFAAKTPSQVEPTPSFLLDSPRINMWTVFITMLIEILKTVMGAEVELVGGHGERMVIRLGVAAATALGSKSGQRRTPPLFELVVNPGLASNGGDSGTTPDAIFPKRKDRQVGISTRRFKQLALIGLGATGILAACSSNSGSSGSTGGASAKGGSTGSGGASAQGGSTGSGGASAKGGSTGSGGASAQGGSTGSGGASAMGGSSATGGTTGSGGATGSGGTCVGAVTLFDFATGDEGWVFNTYQATNAAGVAVSPFNLAAPGNLSGGSLDAGVAAPTIAADSTVGDPPGSLKVVVTFTDYDQQVNPNFNWGSNALQDWTNKVVSVMVKVDPAVPATFNGGIQLYAQDATYAGQYQWSAFPTDNAWHTYTLDMTGTTSVNPAQIIQLTVQLASGSAPTDTGDGGVASFTPTTVTAYIDTITVSGNAGSGGCGGGSTTPASGGAGGSNTTATNGGAGSGTTIATGGAGGSNTTATSGGGSGGGTGPSSCILPSCLQNFGTTCVFSGTCIAEYTSSTGDTNVCYANGVKVIPVTDVTGDDSTVMTVMNGSSACFSTAYNGNNVMGGSGGIITVKNASGATVADVTLDASGTFFIATCTGGQPVSLDPSCSNEWPVSGLMAPSGNNCTQGNCTNAGGENAETDASAESDDGGVIADAAVGEDAPAVVVDAPIDVAADSGLVDSFMFEDGGTSNVADGPGSTCTVISGGNTGNFGTTDAYCFVTCDEIAGWGCSNAAGRTVSVNGTVVSCGSSLTAVNSRYQFEVTAGTYAYASIYWWGTYQACSTH